MKTVVDTFNMAAGYARHITTVCTVGNHSLIREVVTNYGRPHTRTWIHRIDTKHAPFGSLAGTIGAMTCSYYGGFWPIAWRFVRAVMKDKVRRKPKTPPEPPPTAKSEAAREDVARLFGDGPMPMDERERDYYIRRK